MTLRSSGQARRMAYAQLVMRDGMTCYRCGDPIVGERGEVGHVLALAHGGSDELGNLGLEHRACNRKAGMGPPRALIVRPWE